ncbi:hypothetical protein [Falsiroseomonas sp.]|uniref:hypothetical protein n=1 Tax=Falsiroseomonas sp. TaxID=2870721 RepID=UPI00356A4BFB
MTTLAILVVLATIALGAVVGLLHLQRTRRPALVTVHLALAVGGAAVVLWLFATREAPFSGLVPLALIVLAIGAGWGARRIARRSRTQAGVMLPGHVAAGIAAFFVLLAWVKAP